ncbi:transcriptional regulator [Rhodoligotrophos defluvii]|uniref:transcriptional regulator n=1 Tax=Rhodoligotrophos defluvii TaxID=2561934 RepID=UPI0010C96198|nr:transcriptional regulator [Rhodoligotrophos defluvii]
MNQDFIQNLRLLCSYHRSITEVTRKLAMNRQQFMKYLGGGAFPSSSNLRRICDFFGVEEYEILMPHERFSEVVRLRPAARQITSELPVGAQRVMRLAIAQHAQLAKYCGYYYKYFYSFSTPSFILRSLVCIYQDEKLTLYKTVELLSRPEQRDANSDLFKYRGVVLPIGDRLHMIDHESVLGNEMSQTILYPPYRNRVSALIGLMIGITATEAHQPVAARAVLEYLGRQVDRRKAIAGCGLFAQDAPEVPRSVLTYLREASPTDSFLMRAGPDYDKVRSPA